MTATTAAATTGTPQDGGARTRPSGAARARGAALWVVGALVAAVLLGLVALRPSPDGYLHPDGTGPDGARALVEVLRSHGVRVDVVGTSADAAAAAADDGGPTTVVVGNTELLTSTSATRLLADVDDPDRVVLLGATPPLLLALRLGVHLEPPASDARTAGCDAPWAGTGDRVSALRAAVVGDEGRLPDGATACFPVDVPDSRTSGAVRPGSGAVVLPGTAAHAPVTVVGFGAAATNRRLRDDDHAGILVRMLGATPHVVWLHAAAEDLVDNPPSDDEQVWPTWIGPAALLLGLAVVVLGLARGRRLGRLVTEPLPVVVRAVEATESRAELYRAATDRPRAAVVLRRATAVRLAQRLGVPEAAPPDVLVPVVADATGLSTAEVADLLTGPVPTDDAALVTLARQLVHLEEKARRP